MPAPLTKCRTISGFSLQSFWRRRSDDTVDLPAAAGLVDEANAHRPIRAARAAGGLAVGAIHGELIRRREIRPYARPALRPVEDAVPTLKPPRLAV
jgi:hypothetical protein